MCIRDRPCTLLDEVEEEPFGVVEVLLPGGPGLHGVAGAQCAEQELMLVRQVGHAGVGRAELGDEQAQLGADLIEGAQQPHRAGGGEYGPMEGHVVVGDHVPQVRSFTAEDAIDLYRVRRPIETVAVDLMLSQARPVAGVDTALQQFTALGDDVSCSTSVAVAGMCLVVLPGAHDPSSWLGILLATLAAAYAWQAHAIHQLSHRHRPLGVPYRFRIPDPLGSEPEWRIVNAGATQEVHP